jgi:WhiB family redox-sensing transcriptional regulator
MRALDVVPRSSIGVALVAHDCDDVLDELARLLERPAWQADALCREHPDVSWFPGQGEPTDPAKEICARCAVSDECLAFAMETEPAGRFGIWGGLSGRQRRNLHRNAA